MLNDLTLYFSIGVYVLFVKSYLANTNIQNAHSQQLWLRGLDPPVFHLLLTLYFFFLLKRGIKAVCETF